MKLDLNGMHPLSRPIVQHRRFVASIHVHLSTFFGDLCTNDLSNEFFSTNSTYPEDHESRNKSPKFLATIRNYGLHLSTTRGKSELNHYMYAVLKQAAVAGNLDEISETLIEAVFDMQGSWAELSHYVLMDLTPSFIHAAFVSEQGWVLAEPLFHAAQEHLMDIADCDRSGALEGVSEIMASIMHGIIYLMKQRSPKDIRVPSSHELIYVLLMSTRFMLLAFDWLPLIMEMCDDDTKKISDFQASFYLFACGARAYFSSPLRTYIRSLPRFDDPIPDSDDLTSESDDRDSLVGLYELAMDGDSVVDQADALVNLAAPFARNDEEMYMVIGCIKQLHGPQSLVWLFHDMAESNFFKEAESVLEDHPTRPMPHFSDVILGDYRANWAWCSGRGDMEINFGPNKQVVKGIVARGLSLEKMFGPLQKALDEYITSYERLYGMLSTRQIAQYDRIEAGSEGRGLII
jgi:hypothetical protein